MTRFRLPPEPDRLVDITKTVLVAVVGVALATAAPAAARSYRLLRANELFRIRADGSILATEQLTFSFDGTYHGAYRLIPVTGSQAIDEVGVTENGREYASGADPRVGSSGSPGTYGVMTNDDGWLQVAWHFKAASTTRTFTVSYRMRGFVTAYDDVGNLYLQIWGDQWPVPLESLHARVLLPSAATRSEVKLVRVWGHPASVSGTTTIAGPDVVTITAALVPARTFVEMDVTFPRRMLTGTGGFVEQPGNGLQDIVDREKQAFSSPFGPGSGPVTKPGGGGGLPWGWLWLLALPLIGLFRLFGFGRSGKSGSDGFGGSFGGGGGGGKGGGGGGAW